MNYVLDNNDNNVTDNNGNFVIVAGIIKQGGVINA